jgi:predicted DNA-binding mobile mystery protein A
MIEAYQQLDRRFEALKPLADLALRPSHGWIRAIRDALGMTTAQLARRMGVKQPRISELEQAEAENKITLRSLERAAEAMGCRVVYVLVPDRPLGTMIQDRAAAIADQQLRRLDQTMRLEEQSVEDQSLYAGMRARIIDELRLKPSRLWDDV